jgi:predicted Zn-dependent peptidase
LRFENGLEATLISAGSLPKVHIRLVLRAGTVDERADQTWLSHLVAELLKEGAGDRDGDGFADAMAALGGRLHIEPRDDVMLIEAQVLSEFGPQCIDLLADVVRRPALPAGSLARLKADLQRNLGVLQAEPGMMTLARFRRELYGDHPYGRVLPTTDMIDAFTLDDVGAFYERCFGALRAHLYVAGNFDAQAIGDAAQEAFQYWRPGEAIAELPTDARAERTVHLVDRPGAEQSTIHLGLPVIEPTAADYVPLAVLNTLIGGAFMSRITMNIREQKGYTYSPRSEISARVGSAYWVEIADVTTDVTGAALEEIFGEVERLRAEPPSEAELEGIKNYMAGGFILRAATPRGALDERVFVDLHRLGDAYLRTFVDRVYAVTPEEVQRLAQAYLDPARMTLVVSGDAATVSPQLAPFGLRDGRGIT